MTEASAHATQRPRSRILRWAQQDKLRDRKHKKRSRSPENDWNAASKNKDTSERSKKQNNSGNDQIIGNQSYDVSGPSRQMATPLHQMAAAIPPSPQVMHQQPLYPSSHPPHFGYGPGENLVDPNAGNYGIIPSNMNSMMPMPPQWPVNNGLPIPASSVDINSNVCATPVSNGVEMMPSTSSAVGPYPFMGMANNYGIVQPSMDFGPPSVMPFPIISNVPIYLSNAVLTPPLPGEKRSRCPKPDGCRTVFVGNLPEKITQDIIKEAFERRGEIFIIRMSDKRFCHIRFMDMESVEQALLLSGYRIKIENKDEPAYNGKIHVDYAIARDDQRDFECRKRQMEREERHHQLNTFRPPSPPQMPHYSEHEATVLSEKLRNEETFKEGVRVLITWLERGECSKKNSGSFYSMLQSASSHTKKLANEKLKCEEVQKAREKLEMKTRSIQLELTKIEKVYTAAAVQKNWDHFSKNQRRHIEDWKKEIANFSAALIASRVEENMDLDMDENAEECSNEDQTENDELYPLRESNDTLKQQLSSTQKELDYYKQTCNEYYEEIVKLKSISEESQRVGSSEIPVENGYYSDKARKDISVTNSSTHCVPDAANVTANETCLVTLMSIFLLVHPFGANIDYICSYLLRTHPAITTRDIESLLRRFPDIFEEVSTRTGATFKKIWKYVAFDFSAHHNGRQQVDQFENVSCLVTLLSIFLHVHPFGANIDYICSYLLQTHPAVTKMDIEILLRKFPNSFEEVSTGIGATLEKKWKYVAFDSSARPNGR
ncbi:ecto-NOX disulfide-thiol exchanger 1 [Trichonephila clavipes]|uniref:Ecto-NOX disulfide-thiol exchanger 1 n=1 Tax=Trichonephila clavipes TaxID=2585209 RepID=A0A8X6VIA0_TRICX|nr:ecto-NOX disulfide-thiol exchanger 1 [Trichonephila clavipes]